MTQSDKGSRVRALITGTGRYVPDDTWTSDMVEARVDECSGATPGSSPDVEFPEPVDLPRHAIHEIEIDDRRLVAGTTNPIRERQGGRALAAADGAGQQDDLRIGHVPWLSARCRKAMQ